MLSPCPSHPKLSPSRPHPQGHFVSVYERTAPPFARESARWSADPANVQAYLDAGRRMHDVTGCTAAEAFEQLPPHERVYTGSTAGNAWPYELR